MAVVCIYYMYSPNLFSFNAFDYYYYINEIVAVTA